MNLQQLASDIRLWGHQLGFQQVGITDIDLSLAEEHLQQWLVKGLHGEMAYMAHHGLKRSRPGQLVVNTRRVISVRMDYFHEPTAGNDEGDNIRAMIACYARGRDYHKLIRRRLQRLATKMAQNSSSTHYRVFADSAPVLEKPLAQKAGLGWIGKHTNLVNRQAGSWFFLGEIYTDLPLPTDQPATNHCGTCQQCIDICPTRAIIAPYVLDARRCISYLTIELRDAIPEALRSGIGTRIFGCDDCQAVCPWNRFAQVSEEAAFLPRPELIGSTLVELFSWNETQFLHRTEGSPIRRIGHLRWLRNIAVALGNCSPTQQIHKALLDHRHPSTLVQEHVHWALRHQKEKKGSEPFFLL
ncbi:MAG TPA: tRNA epoxyqueuosine(34) reductase QueG [Gammaproteobacteria bacterium]|nr:tRNA epoxyqueuosine(34) reductase QueG [Gammaproteobacteria bacterium]